MTFHSWRFRRKLESSHFELFPFSNTVWKVSQSWVAQRAFNNNREWKSTFVILLFCYSLLWNYTHFRLIVIHNSFVKSFLSSAIKSHKVLELKQLAYTIETRSFTSINLSIYNCIRSSIDLNTRVSKKRFPAGILIEMKFFVIEIRTATGTRNFMTQFLRSRYKLNHLTPVDVSKNQTLLYSRSNLLTTAGMKPLITCLQVAFTSWLLLIFVIKSEYLYVALTHIVIHVNSSSQWADNQSFY